MSTTTRTTTKGKPRRVPQRTCVACRRTGDQPSFVRVVRSPEGEVRPDEGRRHAPGRGAYLCRQRSCWDRALRGALGGALRTRLTEDDRERLKNFAAAIATDETITALAPDGPEEGEDT